MAKAGVAVKRHRQQRENRQRRKQRSSIKQNGMAAPASWHRKSSSMA